MVHYLSLSKKLGGFAATAAFLLLLNGCGSSLSGGSSCVQFLKASESEQEKITDALYDKSHPHGGFPGNYTVATTKAYCEGHAYLTALGRIPFFASYEASVVLPGQSSTTATTPATTTPATPTYPVVKFAGDAVGESEPSIRMREEEPNATDEWSYTAQLASITTSPNGFAPGIQTSPGDEMLMVQVSITSLTTGRMVPTPLGLEIFIPCTGPDSQSWTPISNVRGYDQGSEAEPNPTPEELDLGNGQPVLWDVEWVVPAGTNTAETKCEFKWGKQHSALN